MDKNKPNPKQGQYNCLVALYYARQERLRDMQILHTISQAQHSFVLDGEVNSLTLLSPIVYHGQK